MDWEMILITSDWTLGMIMKALSSENLSLKLPYIAARLALAATLMMVNAYIAVSVDTITRAVR